MRQKRKRIAAGIAAALFLAGLLGLGSGSVAFSQAAHAVNSTLSRFKAMITGDRDTADSPPALEPAPNPNARTIEYNIHFFEVRPSEQGIWQYLKDSGIEFVQASVAPETYLAVISRRQAESFDALWSLRCLSGPKLRTQEGETATIAITDSQEPSDLTSGLAMGWLPMVSDDGTEIWSTVSFHDGRNGVEIPNVAMEPGGIVLIRAKGMWSYSDDANAQEAPLQEGLTQVKKGMGMESHSDEANKQKERPEEMLIQVKLELLQAP